MLSKSIVCVCSPDTVYIQTGTIIFVQSCLKNFNSCFLSGSISFPGNGDASIGKFIGITLTFADFGISSSWLWFWIRRCRIFIITKNTIPRAVVVILDFNFVAILVTRSTTVGSTIFIYTGRNYFAVAECITVWRAMFNSTSPRFIPLPLSRLTLEVTSLNPQDRKTDFILLVL